MWKKSGAWFYREMPNYTKPSDLLLNNSVCNGMPYLTGAGTSGNNSTFYGMNRNSPPVSSPIPSTSQNKWSTGRTTDLSFRYGRQTQNDAYDKISMYEDDNIIAKQKDNLTGQNNTIPATGMFGLGGTMLRMTQRPAEIALNGGATGTKPLPIPTDQQQR